PYTTLYRSFPAVPDIPTFHESGLPGYESSTFFGLLAPAGTPAAIVQKINADVATVLKRDDVRKRLMQDGQIPGGQPSEEFAQFIRDEVAKYAKVIKEAKVPLQ